MLSQDCRGLSKTGHGVKEQKELTEQVPLALEVTAYGDELSALPATSVPGGKEAGPGTLRILSSTLSFKKSKSSSTIHECPSIVFFYLFVEQCCQETTARV